VGITYRFIDAPARESPVIQWFRQLAEPPLEVETERCRVLYFRESGTLQYAEDGSIDPKTSPIVTVILPRVTHRALWTVGEVHFRTAALRRQYPKLHRIANAFLAWISSYECVYSLENRSGDFSYFLEGSIRNGDSPVFAFEPGITALNNGQYMVGNSDNDMRLDQLCRLLRLRGVDCGES
jgi:hypothetical protein